jgi:membrane protein DedA with SNARE-associated domain
MLQRLVELLAGHGLHAGYVAVFTVLLLCGFGLPMPEDVVLATGGVLAWLARDRPVHSIAAMFRDTGLLTMIFVGLAGIIVGDSIIFLAGRKFGHRVADFRPLRRIITPAKLERVEKELRLKGNVLVMLARFLPGLRTPTFFVVGHARLPYWEFFLFDGAAALVSAPLWVCLGFWFGSDIQKAAKEASKFSHYILGAALVVTAILVFRWRRHRAGEVAAAAAARAAAAPPGDPS